MSAHLRLLAAETSRRSANPIAQLVQRQAQVHRARAVGVGLPAEPTPAKDVAVAAAAVTFTYAMYAGVGAMVGLGVAAAMAGNRRPAYTKGALIGSAAGVAGHFLFV